MGNSSALVRTSISQPYSHPERGSGRGWATRRTRVTRMPDARTSSSCSLTHTSICEQPLASCLASCRVYIATASLRRRRPRLYVTSPTWALRLRRRRPPRPGPAHARTQVHTHARTYTRTRARAHAQRVHLTFRPRNPPALHRRTAAPPHRRTAARNRCLWLRRWWIERIQHPLRAC